MKNQPDSCLNESDPIEFKEWSEYAPHQIIGIRTPDEKHVRVLCYYIPSLWKYVLDTAIPQEYKRSGDPPCIQNTQLTTVDYLGPLRTVHIREEQILHMFRSGVTHIPAEHEDVFRSMFEMYLLLHCQPFETHDNRDFQSRITRNMVQYYMYFLRILQDYLLQRDLLVLSQRARLADLRDFLQDAVSLLEDITLMSESKREQKSVREIRRQFRLLRLQFVTTVEHTQNVHTQLESLVQGEEYGRILHEKRTKLMQWLRYFLLPDFSLKRH